MGKDIIQVLKDEKDVSDVIDILGSSGHGIKKAKHTCVLKYFKPPHYCGWINVYECLIKIEATKSHVHRFLLGGLNFPLIKELINLQEYLKAQVQSKKLRHTLKMNKQYKFNLTS